MRSKLQAIVNHALGKDDVYADLYIEARRSTTINYEDHKIEMFRVEDNAGAGLRTFSPHGTRYWYTSETGQMGPLAGVPWADLFRGELGRFCVDCAEDAKYDLLVRTERAVLGVDPCVVRVKLGYLDYVQNVLQVNCEGDLFTDSRYICRLRVEALAVKGGKRRVVSETFGGEGLGMSIFATRYTPETIGRDIGTRAVELLSAGRPPAGSMPVVLGPGIGAVLFHEACGHGLEADMVQRGTSVFRGLIGERIASPAITYVDDPSLAGYRGSYRCDDDCSPAAPTVLIENGILKNYLYDRFTAMMEGKREMARAGHGRRDSYIHAPKPRMSNTYIMPGNYTPEEVVAATERGIYVKSIGAGNVKTTSGEFIFYVKEGFIIENGKRGRPVRGATLLGNARKVLLDVDMVANDLEFDTGSAFCFKAGQWVPVSVGQPTLRVAELIVGGRETEDA